VVRRLFPLFVLALFLCVVPSALAQPSPTQTAAHDPAVETVSRADASPDTDAPPGATPEESVRNQWGPPGPDNRDSIETFRFNVAPGEMNSSFTVKVGWGDPDIDFDIFVYRIRDNGTLDPEYIASAATADDPEIVEYSSSTPGEPIRQDQYIVAVHNYCSSSADPPGSCDYLGPPDPSRDEDFWEAEVTFTAFDPSNVRPSVSLTGPTSGSTGELLTYEASPSDPDGQITDVAFDLDGDGRHETPTGSRTASTSFGNPGLYTVGVRVVDNEGAPAYASVDVRITGPATSPNPNTTAAAAKSRILSSFKLNRPVFGGRKLNRLVVRYRLREPGRAIVSLYRGKKRIKRLSSGNRRPNRTYRINVSPRRLRRGATYTVRVFVRSADGTRTQRARLSAKRL
jgi:hypothetical protein